MKALIGQSSLALIILIVVSCGSKKALPLTPSAEEQVLHILPPPYTRSYNIDSTYILFVGSGNSKSNPLSKSYCVFDNSDNLLIDKRTIHGKVGWYDLETLMIEKTPRVIRKRDVAGSVITYLKIKEANVQSK